MPVELLIPPETPYRDEITESLQETARVIDV